MSQQQLTTSMHGYREWREQLIETIDTFRRWLDQNELASPEQELRIFEAIDALRQDRLTIAFVAEFSRGKTELINALFLSSYGKRVLPSDAGRTTMCPTELFYDNETDESYLQLLPIETRLQERSIADLKHDLAQWTRIKLDTESSDQIEKAFREVVKTKQVPLETARKLGLYDENTDPYFKSHGEAPEQVEIPFWRHALISFPHELLKQGLVILDTPGLNALGSEPELTLDMLPAAQAVMFMLGADTGVTSSDMEMWEHHVKSVRGQQNKNLVVVLNKIDTLWDELKEASAVRASIESQRKASAEQLHVPVNQVFPLSAQKGLLAKIRNEPDLLKASRLPELEEFLAKTVLPSRQELVRDNLSTQIGSMIEENTELLKNRINTTIKQLDELRSLRGKNADVITHLMAKSREEQAAYLRNVESFQNSRRLLQTQARNMLDALSMEMLDRLINKTRKTMTSSWTTMGMKRGMEGFFDGTRDAMEQVSSHSEQTRMLIRATYRKFHESHGLPQLSPRQFSITGYSAELERLYHDADSFRRSPVTAMTEQSYVIKNFFISLVSQTRSLFLKANRDTNIWLKEVMTPLVKQIKEHKNTMEKRLETLRRISDSRDTLEVRIKSLENSILKTGRQLETLEKLNESMQKPLPIPTELNIENDTEETSTEQEAVT